MKHFLTAAVVYLFLSGTALAQSQGEYRVTRATTTPKIDGVLDDAAWGALAPMPTGQWKSYNPNRGDDMPEAYRTEVRVTYDDRSIYFAFHCFDNEPDRIRTNVTRRDAAFSDDWIAISLDSAATGQAAYHLFSNPSASQMDALNTSPSGEQFDADMVWFSGAKTTPDGYIVEVQIPLQTLRFSGADLVNMNLVLFRKVSRIGYSYAWPEMHDGDGVLQPHGLHQRVDVQRGQLLSEVQLGAADPPVRLCEVGQGSHPGRRRGLHPYRRALQRHPAGLLQLFDVSGPRDLEGDQVSYRSRLQRLWQHADAALDFQGRSQSFSIGTTIQPNQHLSQSFDFFRTRFWRPSNGDEIYAISIVNARTTYQFDKHFLARVLARYDSSRDRLLTDWLASYEFVPGTVFHLGYGSLYEKGFGAVEIVPGAGIPELVPGKDASDRFVLINRGLFLKASYLRRF